MFDYDYCVVQVVQVGEGVEQVFVVVLVQVDGWFVEYVYYVDQVCIDLVGQLDVLGFVIGQSVSFVFQGEVIQVYIDQEVQLFVDFFDDFVGDFVMLVWQVYVVEEFQCFVDWQYYQFWQCMVGYEYMVGGFVQVCVVVFGVVVFVDVFGQFFVYCC